MSSVNSSMMLRPQGLAGLDGPRESRPPTAVSGADFGQTVASMIADAARTVAVGETAAIAGMQGKASVQDVVAAVIQAEQALHTMVAVRDKVVGAYLEISRMQI